MNAQIYKQALEQILSLAKQKEFGRACKKIEDLLTQQVFTSQLFVHRARFIQMSDENDIAMCPELTLEVALESLKIAHELEPTSITPLIEWGYFEYAVKGHSDEALKIFQKAQKFAESSWQDSLIGQLKCYHDLGLVSESKEVMNRLKVLFPDDPELKIFQSEIELY